MKKLFTLIAAALMTIGASAKTPLTATWNSWGDGCTVDGNTITFTAAWKGAGYWVSADASTSDKLVIVLAEEAVGKTKIFFQCQPETGENLVSSGDYFITAGSKILGIDLQSDAAKDRLSAFQQICAQSTEANCKIVVKEIYLGTNEEYENDLAGNKQQTSPLTLADLGSGWGGSTYDAATKTVTIGDDWTGKGWWLGTVDYSDFDQLVIKFDPATATNGNIVIEYNAGESTKYEFAAGTTTAIIDLDATGKASVKQIYIQGPAASKYVLSAAYVATKEYVAENETTGGEEATGGEATDTKFNVAKYTTLDGIDKKNCTTLYKYDETAKAVILTAYGAYQSSVKSLDDETKKGLGWVTYNSAGSSNVADGWAATGVFQGSAYYGLLSSGSASHRAAAINSSRAYTFTVTGCKAVSILGKSGKKTEREVILTVKESGSDANFAEKKDATNEIVTLTVDGMDASKTYEVTVTGNTSDNGHFYEIAFYLGSTTGIQQTIAPAKVIENNVIYNLAGQRVNENYKGIVIKNGKKFIQK